MREKNLVQDGGRSADGDGGDGARVGADGAGRIVQCKRSQVKAFPPAFLFKFQSRCQEK